MGAAVPPIVQTGATLYRPKLGTFLSFLPVQKHIYAGPVQKLI